MMGMSFEEWLNENYKIPEHGMNYNFKNAMEKIWNFQQNRINELEKKNHELSLALNGYYPLNDFIQARGIDAKNLGRNYGDIAVDKINKLEKQLEEAEKIARKASDIYSCDLMFLQRDAEEYFKNKEKK